MPRQSSSDSRQRSRHRSRRVYRDASSSPDTRRRLRNEKRPRQQSQSPPPAPKVAYDIKRKSDIKNHFWYENIRVYSQKEADDTMRQVRQVLSQQFGPVAQTTKLNKEQTILSFGIGFKYDEDAMEFAKKGGYISTQYSRHKLVHTITPVFQQCMPMIKDAMTSRKARYSAASPAHHSHSKVEPSVQKVHKKRKYSSSSSQSRRVSKQKSSHKRRAQSCLWIFGLSSHIKGKDVGDFFYYKLPVSPLEVLEWKWIKVKGSNCQFMEVIMDSKKAQKLLNFVLTEQLMINGCPCIVVKAEREVTDSSVMHSLKQYQFKITFPEKINPANLYAFLRGYSRVVQLISCNKLSNGKSDSFTVTLGSSSKVRDMKKLRFRGDEIKIDDTRGQLVYRPTKHSKIIDNE